MRRALRFATLACAAIAFAPPAARAWIYSEHRAITARGIDTLDPRRRALLDRVWSEARADRTGRLCEAVDAGSQGEKDNQNEKGLAMPHACIPHPYL